MSVLRVTTITCLDRLCATKLLFCSFDRFVLGFGLTNHDKTWQKNTFSVGFGFVYRTRYVFALLFCRRLVLSFVLFQQNTAKVTAGERPCEPVGALVCPREAGWARVSSSALERALVCPRAQTWMCRCV